MLIRDYIKGLQHEAVSLMPDLELYKLYGRMGQATDRHILSAVRDHEDFKKILHELIDRYNEAPKYAMSAKDFVRDFMLDSLVSDLAYRSVPVAPSPVPEKHRPVSTKTQRLSELKQNAKGSITAKESNDWLASLPPAHFAGE